MLSDEDHQYQHHRIYEGGAKKRRDHSDFLHRIVRFSVLINKNIFLFKKMIEGDQFWMPRSDYVVNALQTNFMRTRGREMILLLFS